ncbi:hypothetical protein IKL64_03860 [bacterium]|nr:hypothetical protein [bacterium]
MTKKKTILVDLDGVLNQYNGRFDELQIPDIKEGAKEFVENLSQNFIVKIFTTRNKILATKWLIKNNLDKYITDITDIKEPSHLHIDDRCICFDGNFSNTINQIKNFRPWYK